MGIKEIGDLYKKSRLEDLMSTPEGEFNYQYNKQFKQPIAPGQGTLEDNIIDQISHSLADVYATRPEIKAKGIIVDEHEIRRIVEKEWKDIVANAREEYRQLRTPNPDGQPVKNEFQAYGNSMLRIGVLILALTEKDYCNSVYYNKMLKEGVDYLHGKRPIEAK